MPHRQKHLHDPFKYRRDIILLTDPLSPRQYILETRWKQLRRHHYPFKCHLHLHLLIHTNNCSCTHLFDCLLDLLEDHLHHLLMLSEHGGVGLVVVGRVEVLHECRPSTDRHTGLV